MGEICGINLKKKYFKYTAEIKDVEIENQDDNPLIDKILYIN